MKSRRVLHITGTPDGGLAVVVDQLTRGLNKKDYEPIVAFDTPWQSNIRRGLSESYIITIDLLNISDEQHVRNIKIRKRVDYGRLIQSWFGKAALDIYLSLKLALEFILKGIPKVCRFVQIIRKYNIDLVHTHRDLNKSKAEIIAARLLRVPCINHIHGYSEYNSFDRLFRRFVISSIYISSDVAEHQYSQGAYRDKGTVIHNGVDISMFDQQYDTTSLRRQFNVLPGETLIGIIGRIDWWKGQDYFIEAIGEVVKTSPNVKGLIVGGIYNDPEGRNKDYFDHLKNLLKSENLEDKIIFTGFREDVPQIISSLDVVVHASSEPEPFGLVIIEAMAAKKSIVATGAGGVLDIINNGVNGLLVPCKDSRAMAQAILTIISNKELAKNLGLKARERVVEKFTIQRQVAEIQNLYGSIFNVFRS